MVRVLGQRRGLLVRGHVVDQQLRVFGSQPCDVRKRCNSTNAVVEEVVWYVLIITGRGVKGITSQISRVDDMAQHLKVQRNTANGNDCVCEHKKTTMSIKYRDKYR